MIFYVFLSPDIIKLAHEAGSQNIQALIGILRGFTKNCFLVDFDNYSIQNQIRDLLGELLGDYDITVLKKLLTHFIKQNLFINCIEYSYEPNVTELDMVLQQYEKCSIDLLLLPDGIEIKSQITAEVATITNYQISDFEPLRSDFATVGITLNANSMDEKDFLNTYLKKALKYAQTIEIFDYLSGEKYKSNYDYTMGKFFGWLKDTNNEDLRISIHCGFPSDESNLFEKGDFDGLDLDGIRRKKKEKLTEAINKHYNKSAINIVCYENKFAHDRFVITNQIAFEIGIGMDFINHKNANRGKIRDITIHLKDATKVRNLIEG